jgi:hypothetical protein
LQPPTSDFITDGLRGACGDGRSEIDEEFAPPSFRLPRTKRITKKIELLAWVISSPVFILAIDNLRLLRMKLQPTLLKPLRYGIPNFLSLASRPAMHDGIIGIPLKRQMRKLPRHPHIERDGRDES